MDQENMNQENAKTESSQISGTSNASNSYDEEDLGPKSESKNMEEERTAKPDQSEESKPASEESTYHLEKEAIPVQKEYVQGKPEIAGQSSSQGGNVYGGGNPYQNGNAYGQGIYTGNDYASSAVSEEPKKKKKAKKAKKKGSGKAKKVVGFVASAAAFGLIAGGVMFGVNAIGNKALGTKDKTVSEVTTVQTADKGVKEAASDDTVADVAEEVMPSIVSITNKSVQVVRSWFQSYEQEVEGAGSGIIIGQTDDEILIATNNHVIDGAKELTVTFCDEESVAAEIKDTDSGMDLAVVAVKISDMEKSTLDAIKVAALGSSDELRVGERAIAIGNALGYGQSVTVGYISAVDREVDAEGTTHRMIQTDAAINPGNSGGALLNSKGEVIGINSIKYADTQVEGMGYAIPISKAIPIINDMMNSKVIKEAEQGYLGISGNSITDEYVQGFNMPKGVYVTKLIEDSPADKAGLMSGDIITKFDDREVSTMEELQSILSKRQAGEEVSLVVQRNNGKGEYKEVTLTVTLGAKKDMPSNDSTSKKSKSDKSDNSDVEEDSDSSSNNNDDSYNDDSDSNNGSYYDDRDQYNEDGNDGYRDMDPEEFFRQFEEYFNR